MHDDDTLEDADELLRDVRERRWRAPGLSGSEAAGDEGPASGDRDDDETAAVRPQGVGEAGAGWLVPDDDEETIDVDPELLRKLRSGPAAGATDEDETVVADVSRLADSGLSGPVVGSAEVAPGAPGPALEDRMPVWAQMAGALLVVALLVAVALLAGWRPISG